MKNVLILLTALILPFVYAFCDLPAKQHYNFEKPDAYYVLPDTLHEISGLTDIDDGRIGCVQDENGIVFIYNLYQSRIEAQHTFYLNGDYEGITLAGNDMYVLRSNGTLFRISNFLKNDGHTQKVDSFATHIANLNNEGLCYDAPNNRLLIASKSKLSRTREEKDKRYVYAFDLKKMRTDDEPFLVIDVNDIAAAVEQNNINLGQRVKKNGQTISKKVKFMPSSIAIHPITKEYYLMSAVDRLMIVVNDKAEVMKVYQFNPILFPKPEGITFFTNGDLFIANEGKGQKPNLMRFNYSR